MHRQESSIDNHDTRRATTKEILFRLCPEKHDEHDWNNAVHDFLHTNFAEIEARIVAHHLANGASKENLIDFEPIEDGYTATMRKVSEPEQQLNISRCSDKLENGRCNRFFKKCDNHCSIE